MIRTTDTMLKAMNVVKAKERLASNRDALARAEQAKATEFVAMFRDFVSICETEVATAEAWLRNPAI
jgi:hypothetical protein